MCMVSLWWPEDNSVEMGSFELRSPDLCGKCLYPMNQLVGLVLISCWIHIIMALLGSCYSRWSAVGGCRLQVTRPWGLYITLTLPVLLPLSASSPWRESSTPAHLPTEARGPLSFPAFQLFSQVLWAQRMQGIKHKSQAGSVPWCLITHHIWPFCQTGLQNYSKNISISISVTATIQQNQRKTADGEMRSGKRRVHTQVCRVLKGAHKKSTWKNVCSLIV